MAAPRQADPVGTRLNIAIAAMVVVLAVLVVLIVLSGGDDGGNEDLEAGGTTATTTAAPGSTGGVDATTLSSSPESTAGLATTTTLVPSAVADPSITDANVGAVLSTFDQFVAAINRRDLPAAYALLGPNQQARQSFDDFAAGERSTQLFDYVLARLSTNGSTGTAHVTFRSTQDAADGPGGQTCSLWQLDEDMLLGSDGVWRIDHGRATDGTPIGC